MAGKFLKECTHQIWGKSEKQFVQENVETAKKNMKPRNSRNTVGCDQKFTRWGRVMHICLSKLIIFGSDNGLSPSRRQAIIRTNAGILLIRHLEQISVNS